MSTATQSKAVHPVRPTLVIGGPHAFVQGTLREKFARWGLSIEWHWAMDRPLRSADARLPLGCAVVILLQDMTPHASTFASWLRDAAKESGVVVVRTKRQEAFFAGDLARAGIHPIGPHVAAAIREDPMPITPEKKTEAKPITTTPAPTAQPPQRTIDEAKAALRLLLRELRDEHGVTDVLWGKETGLELRRPVIQYVTDSVDV